MDGERGEDGWTRTERIRFVAAWVLGYLDPVVKSGDDLPNEAVVRLHAKLAEAFESK